MQQIITKSITNDFPNGEFSIKQFNRQLRNTFINNEFLIENKNDSVTVSFQSPIDLSVLDNLVANFAYDASYDISGTEPIVIYPAPENRIFFNNYGLLTSFSFPGTLVTGMPTSIILFACISELATTGTVRIYDATNAKEICVFTTIESRMPNTIIGLAMKPHLKFMRAGCLRKMENL
jgi:hypothetical protein